MNKLKKSVFLNILFFGMLSSHIIAQTLVQIPGTSLKIELPNGFIVDEKSSIIMSEVYVISFLELRGVNYADNVEDFETVELEYANQGIKIKEKRPGKVSEYDAHFLILDTNPPMHQIYFGNKEFCVLTSIASVDPQKLVNEIEISSILKSIKFMKSTISPLEESALFIHNGEGSEWKFTSHSDNLFGFESSMSENILVINQLPPSTLNDNTKKELAHNYIAKYKDYFPEIIEEGNWQTNNFSGYRLLLNLKKKEVNENELIYIFIFGNNKSVFVFRGFGKSNDAYTKHSFSTFIKELEFKE